MLCLRIDITLSTSIHDSQLMMANELNGVSHYILFVQVNEDENISVLLLAAADLRDYMAYIYVTKRNNQKQLPGAIMDSLKSLFRG